MYKQNYILLFIYSQKDMEIQSNWNNLVPQCKKIIKETNSYFSNIWIVLGKQNLCIEHFKRHQ